MASGPITSWQIGGKTGETVVNFIFGGSKITADGVCSHEIKRCLLIESKVMTNLDSILKSRDITLPTKQSSTLRMPAKQSIQSRLCFFQWSCMAMNWTVKKAEHQRIDAFELWCQRRLLRVPWTAKRSNQSILKEISPE